jgi:hypothetical protein
LGIEEKSHREGEKGEKGKGGSTAFCILIRLRTLVRCAFVVKILQCFSSFQCLVDKAAAVCIIGTVNHWAQPVFMLVFVKNMEIVQLFGNFAQVPALPHVKPKGIRRKII